MNPFSRLFGSERTKKPNEALPAVVLNPQQTVNQIENSSSVRVYAPPSDITALKPPEAPGPDPVRPRNQKIERKLLGATANPWLSREITHATGDLGNTMIYAGISAATMGPDYYHDLHKHKEITKALNHLENIPPDMVLTPVGAHEIITLTTKLGAGARQKDIEAATSAVVQLEAANVAAKDKLTKDEKDALAALNKNHKNDDKDPKKNDQLVPEQSLLRPLDAITPPVAPTEPLSPYPFPSSTPVQEAVKSAVAFGLDVALPRHGLAPALASKEPARNSQEIPSLKKPDGDLINAQADYDKWDLRPKEKPETGADGKQPAAVKPPIKIGDLPAEQRLAVENDMLLRAGAQWKHMNVDGRHHNKVLNHGTKELVISELKERHDHIIKDALALQPMAEHVQTLKDMAKTPSASKPPHVSEDYFTEHTGPLPIDTPASKDTVSPKATKTQII